MNTSTSGTRPIRKRPRHPIIGSSCHAANPASRLPAGSNVLDQAPLALATGAHFVPIRTIDRALDCVREAFYVARAERKTGGAQRAA
jgi:hypothetical protein